MKNLFILLFITVSGFGFSQINQKDSQGRKQGVWKKPHPNNKSAFQYVGQFKNDKPYGEFTYFYETGGVQSKMKFNTDGTAYNTMYHESSGYVMAKGKYVNQQKDSLWLYYDNQGNLKSQESYKNGKLEGQRVVYYEPINGQYMVARFEYYKDGVLHGQFKEYYPNTKIKAEGVYRTGNLNGMVKFYRPSGKIERVERYQYAVKHGWWVFYNENGTQAGKKLYYEGRVLKGQELEEKAKEFERKK